MAFFIALYNASQVGRRWLGFLALQTRIEKHFHAVMYLITNLMIYIRFAEMNAYMRIFEYQTKPNSHEGHHHFLDLA